MSDRRVRVVCRSWSSTRLPASVKSTVLSLRYWLSASASLLLIFSRIWRKTHSTFRRVSARDSWTFFFSSGSSNMRSCASRRAPSCPEIRLFISADAFSSAVMNLPYSDSTCEPEISYRGTESLSSRNRNAFPRAIPGEALIPVSSIMRREYSGIQWACQIDRSLNG